MTLRLTLCTALCPAWLITGRSSRHKKKWRERDESVRSNFLQYQLDSKYLDVLVADASKHDLWALDGLIDAIVTDRKYLELSSLVYLDVHYCIQSSV